jgi:hypothetical protein
MQLAEAAASAGKGHQAAAAAPQLICLSLDSFPAAYCWSRCSAFEMMVAGIRLLSLR